MRVLVTGAGGFIGRELIKLLLKEPVLMRGNDGAEQLGELIVTGRSSASVEDLAQDPRVRVELGDAGDPAFYGRLFAKRIDSIFHLPATLTAEAENNFRRGLEVNILGMIHLLEQCRAQESPPRVVFPSSIAAFGGPLPEPVDDKTAQTPQTSYGIGKSIAELLINDYSRHGFIDGRALRLPVVIIRPGASSVPSVADRIGAVLREPLLGREAVCPLAPETRVPVASVRTTVSALLRLHEVPADRFGHTRAMNMPALAVSLQDMADAVMAYDYPGRRGRILWEKDDNIQAVVDSWPRAILAEEANRLGLRADASVAEILRSFIEDFAPSA
ncbi:MAG: NAD-dependent epimerase/dehydratase family protein [Rhodomicrobiaceae bacterium]